MTDATTPPNGIIIICLYLSLTTLHNTITICIMNRGEIYVMISVCHCYGFKFDHMSANIARQLWIALKLIVLCKRIMFTYIDARMDAPCSRKLTIIPKVGETITEDAYDVSVTKQQLHGKQSVASEPWGPWPPHFLKT